jgi:4-amino-4-deoxy-L-arabinose transferase-like glycosyltransferase
LLLFFQKKKTLAFLPLALSSAQRLLSQPGGWVSTGGMPQPVGRPVSNVVTLVVLAVVGLVAVGLIAAQWVGYYQSDDMFYARAANGYLHRFPYLPVDHWGLRHVIVGPMVLAFALFGENEATLTFVMPMYFVGIVVLVFACAQRFAGRRAALIAVALAATSPMLTVASGYVSTDLPEAFYVMASLFAFLCGVRERRRWQFVLAGAMAALAMLTRETSAALLAFYGLLFLAGVGGRANYFVMAGGFLPILALDMAVLGWESGDPLYRWHTAMRGAAGDGPHLAATTGERDETLLPVPYRLRAVLMPFLHQSFGLFTWLALPVAVAGAWWRRRVPGHRELVLLLGFCACWQVVNFYGLSQWLWVIARYMLVLVPALSIAAGIAADALFPERLPRWAVAAFVGVLASTAVVAGARNNDLLFGERALAEFAATVPTPIVTDPATLDGALWLLEVSGRVSQVTAGAPRAGAIWFANERPRRRNPDPKVTPGAGWRVVGEFVSVPPPVVRLVGAFPLERFLPAHIAAKLRPIPRRATAYLVPAG